MPPTLYTRTQKYGPPCCSQEVCLDKWATIPVANVAPELLAEAQPFTDQYGDDVTTGKQSPQAKRSS
jgi:hypothetical protein